MTTKPDAGSTLSGLPDGALEQCITPALELAIVVGRVLTAVRPPEPVPRGMRPLVRFTRLPVSARPAVRKVIDDDEGFRERVARAAAEMDVPHPCRLFLERPAGWEQELAAVVRHQAAEEAANGTERESRALERRLAGAETAVARLEQALTRARAEAARVADELAGERLSRREAEEALDALRRRAASLEGERQSARRAAEAEVAELERLRAELAVARREMAVGAAERAALQDEIGSARAGESAAQAQLAPDTRRSMIATSAVSSAIAEAADAAGALARALAAAASAVGPPRLVTDDGVVTEETAVPATGRRSPTRSRAERSAAAQAGRRRIPQALPVAMFDDSTEAAEHLVHVPGMVVLVDGYNVTLSAWQNLPICVQRVRLVDACAELAARSGCQVLIVFDGAGEPGDIPPRTARNGVRWQFSAPGVEADDVLLDLVADLDPDRPLTVASSDRRVRDGARHLGANAISTPQLLAALRRAQAVKAAGRP